MIRPATSHDDLAVREVLRAGNLNSVAQYSYAELDGPCVVDDHDGEIRGVVRYFLGKPETWIRQLAVTPKYRATTVARDLVIAVGQAALDHGSEGIEGFVPFDLPGVAWAWQRMGARLYGGVRVRWAFSDSTWTAMLNPPAAAASPSTTTSPATSPETGKPPSPHGPSVPSVPAAG